MTALLFARRATIVLRRAYWPTVSDAPARSGGLPAFTDAQADGASLIGGHFYLSAYRIHADANWKR
jgi:hypothetical protein